MPSYDAGASHQNKDCHDPSHRKEVKDHDSSYSDGSLLKSGDIRPERIRMALHHNNHKLPCSTHFNARECGGGEKNCANGPACSGVLGKTATGPFPKLEMQHDE
jgi:hypothetical protein